MNLTCLKSGIWQVELRIPSDVRVVLGRTRFAQSTGTRDKRKATSRALSMLAEWLHEHDYVVLLPDRKYKYQREGRCVSDLCDFQI